MTKADLETLIAAYIDAETKILKGQTVVHNGKTISRANLEEVIAGREALELKLSRFGMKQHATASFR